MGGRGVELLVFLLPALLSCLAERVNIQLTDFTDGEEEGANVAETRGADLSGGGSAEHPPLNEERADIDKVIEYVLGRGENEFTGDKADFYKILCNHKYNDYSKGRTEHKARVELSYRLLIGRQATAFRRGTMAKMKEIKKKPGNEEMSNADLKIEALKHMGSQSVFFQTGLPGALRPEIQEAHMHTFTTPLLLSWEDVKTLFVGNTDNYRKAVEADLFNADMLEDAHEVYTNTMKEVRKNHVSALFVSPPLDYESEVKPFVVNEPPFGKITVTFLEAGCPDAAATCSFAEIADASGGGATADDVWKARLNMILQAKEAKAQGGPEFAFSIANDVFPRGIPMDLSEQPTDRGEAEGYPLSYKK